MHQIVDVINKTGHLLQIHAARAIHMTSFGERQETGPIQRNPVSVPATG